ncbi:MAG: hypothetical protein ABW080_06140 [Candidatus Thiodiazotropha sp.]
MSEYRLISDHYVLPTPAGAYTAAAHAGEDAVRRLLCTLLQQASSPQLTQRALEEWTGMQGQDAQDVLFHAQSQQWIEGFEQPRPSPQGALETLLPELIPKLSDSKKVMLADAHGFYVAVTGFTHEAAVELAALSADIASLDARHSSLIKQNLRLACSAWSLIDAAGNSQLGFWPLFIDRHRFVLILQGQPRFNQPAFTDLVWILSTRYSQRQQT